MSGLCVIRAPRRGARARLVAVGVWLVLVGTNTGCVATAPPVEDRPSDSGSTPSPSPTAMAGEGWIAYATYGPPEDIYFVKAGSAPRLVLESDGASRGQVCPAFSPDGTRLASGQGGYGQQGPKDGALVITDLTAEGDVAASEVIPLDGLRQQPCPIWSPDGRWVAFGVGSGRNVHTWAYGSRPEASGCSTRRRARFADCRGLSATDIEWAADSSQLYIAAADGILVYSIADDQTRTLDDSKGAVALSASPDGGSLAVERRRRWPRRTHRPLRTAADERRRHGSACPCRGLRAQSWDRSGVVTDGNRIVFQGGDGAPLVFRCGRDVHRWREGRGRHRDRRRRRSARTDRNTDGARPRPNHRRWRDATLAPRHRQLVAGQRRAALRRLGVAASR